MKNDDPSPSATEVSSDLALIYFVVAWIYVLFLLVLLYRTCMPLFSCKRFKNTRTMQYVRAFYGSLLAQTFLNCSLYWTLFG